MEEHAGPERIGLALVGNVKNQLAADGVLVVVGEPRSRKPSGLRIAVEKIVARNAMDLVGLQSEIMPELQILNHAK